MITCLEPHNWPGKGLFARFGENDSFKYSHLQGAVGQIIRWWMANPLPPGSVVALDSGDPHQFVVWLLASLRCGHTIMPLDRHAPAARMRRLITQSAAAAVVCDPDVLEDWRCESAEMHPMRVATQTQARGLGKLFGRKRNNISTADSHFLDALPTSLPPKAEIPAPPTPGQVALLLYTSGSSGAPKGVQLTHLNLETHLTTLRKVYGLGEHSRLLNNLALHHADGLVQGPLLSLFVGATWLRPVSKMGIATVEPLLASFYRTQATHIFLVPFFMELIRGLTHWQKTAFAYPECEMVISVSAKLPAPLWQEMEQRFGVRVVNVYGLTETVAGSLFAGPEEATRVPGTVGIPVDCEAKIEGGELWLRGAHISPGYRGTDEGPWTADGWLRTGDLASKDAATGCYIIEGRIKNACNISGYLVRPEEVTEALCKLPGIADAVCFGLAEERVEERLAAAIVTAVDHPWHSLELQHLHQVVTESLREELEEYKVPVAIQVWSALPYGDSGKVQLPRVRTQWAEEEAQTAAAHGREAPPDASDFTSAVLDCARQAFRSTDVHPQSDSTNTQGWDSMAHLDLIQRIEAKFQVQFSVSETMRANAIATLVRILEQKRNAS